MTVFCLSPAARAATLADVQIPDTLTVDGKQLVLNGYGLRTLTFLKVKIYVAALYLPKKSNDAQAILASAGPKVLVLNHIHSGSKSQVQDRYKEGIKVNCGDEQGSGCPADLRADYQKLFEAAKPVAEGDVTQYIVTDKQFRVVFNGVPVISFNNVALGNMILAGFIGAHPPSPDLRAALLGVPM
ncbi:MAG: chalcone isomerase family protein [Proteobacteria bacterium]|nr:chalcone isomerase family protein [Pseudomonadota bacterium]